MRGKLLGFALALMSVATIGVVQLTTHAQEPGQVGSSPVCTVKASGARSSAFAVNGTTATVHFTVSGKSNCRVQLSANSFYAPSMNGMPYSKQILYQRVTKNYTRGSYAMSVRLPSQSTPNKGCYYQVDLTYGTHNVTPVLAYGHGKISGCGTPKPSAVCKSLTVTPLSRTSFRFNAQADTANGATISKYAFTVTKGGQTVAYRTVTTSSKSASYTYSQTTPGTYTVKLGVATSVGAKTGSNCVKTFTVTPSPSAVCKSLTVTPLERTKFRFDATAVVSGGATVSSYDFTISKDNAVIDTDTVTTSALTASSTYSQATPGDYVASVVVNTSAGQKQSEACKEPFTVSPPEENPTAVCKSLTVDTIESNQRRFTATSEVTGNATINGYEFTVSKDNAVVDTKTVTSSATTATYDYTQDAPGDYTVDAVVKTSLGDRDGEQCHATFTIPEEETHPNIKITKYVENLKHKRVGVNIEYEYEIAVTNTGETDLTDAVVTDEPEQGITLVSASAGSIDNNTWTYTIPALNVGETLNFTLKAKVPVYLAGTLTNTVCVDAPEVPGKPDDCDSATVDLPPPGKTEVCNPETGNTMTVDEKDADQYLPVNSPECETTPVTPPQTPPTPSELPQTGAADVVMQLVGATSLAGAGSYYLASRRQRS